MRGGYKIVSLENQNITPGGAGVTIKGVYDSIESNHQKAILLSDITIDNVERADRFIEFSVENSDYVGLLVLTNLSDVEIRITSDDVVTITNYS